MSTEVTSGGNEGVAPGFYQCGSCKRQYKRLDHLARHVRSHTHFKPHKCSFCSRAFARTDLLKRHVAGHEAQGDKAESGLRAQRGPTDAPGRVTQACKACAANHIRCTESKPCRRCQNKGIDCIWNLNGLVRDASPEGQKPEEEESTADSSTLNGSIAEHSSAVDVAPVSVQTTDALSPVVEEESQNNNLPYMDNEVSHETIMQPHHQPAFLGYALDVRPEGLTGFSTPKLPDWNFLPSQLPSQPGQDTEMDMPDFLLDDIDMRLMDLYNESVPFEFGGGSQTDISEPQDQLGSFAQLNPGKTASEAFRKYHWTFRPNTKDRLGAEEHNLSLPSGDSADAGTPESRVPMSRRADAPILSVTARDSILAIVAKGCRPENLARAIASFPSVELLDRLVQYYLMSPIADAEVPFIHAATFDPNKKRPELLLAMIAAGAVLTSDPTLAKLGFALQELVRPAVSARWEADNSLVRDPELLQAFLIHLEVGIWSGHGRKMEITESFLQPPVTMMRRAAQFRRSAYTDISVQPEDNGVPLQETWTMWVRQETFKRLAFRMLCHDTSSSMCLSVNPLISYAEVSLRLPCSPALWNAATPEKWRDQRLNEGSKQPCTLPEYLADPGILGSPFSPSVDMAIAHEAFISCAWRLSWECMQLRAMHRANPGPWNSLILSSRQDEIIKMLNRFRISLGGPTVSVEKATMRLELLMLHLHVPFEEMQTFVGMEGPDAAYRARSVMAEWMKGEAARKAVWHAGQIVRLAGRRPRGAIRGPEAFYIYHGALVLWVYGLLLNDPAIGSVDHSTSRMDATVVRIDEEENIDAQKFVQFGIGRPCFKAAPDGMDLDVTSNVPLNEPEKVMTAVVMIMSANYEGLPKPHLVERLIQLMEALQLSSAALLEFHKQA